MRRILRSITMVVASSTVLFGLAPPPVASQQVGPPAGNWHGYFHYFSDAAFDTDEGDVPVIYTATGTFNFVTANGFLTGDYELLVEAELTELGTTANAIASGDLSGPATEPDMILQGTSVSSGVGGIVMDFSFSAAELGNPQGKMIPTGGDCSNLYGVWNQEFSLGMEAQGGTVDQLEGSWHAFRDSSTSDGDPGALEAEMESFSALGQTILNDVRSGTVNTADLRDYLAVAEGAIVSGTRRSNCEEGIDAGSEARFRSLAAATVDDILGEAALGIDSIDDLTFLSLMLSGYRTGSFDEATELRDFYEADFERRTDAAMSSGDPGTLRIFLVSATQLGKNDLATDLVNLLGEVGG